MIVEIVLIILGILTFCLGIWNIIIGAYVWGSLFLLSGLWSIWLGSVYIIQLRKVKKKDNANLTQTNLSTLFDDQIPESSEPDPFIKPDDLADTFTVDEDAIKFDNAVIFTNEVIPTPAVSSDDLDKLDENSQLTAEIKDIDPNIEVMQNLVKSQDNSDQ